MPCSRNVAVYCLVGSIAWCANGQGVPAQAPPTVRQAGMLLPQNPQERDLAPGATDLYTVALTAGQFLHVMVDKKGVDVTVALIDPAGKTLLTANSPNGSFGLNPVSLIAERDGLYEIRVKGSSITSVTGKYRIELDGPRLPNDADRTRLQAEAELFAAAASDRSQDKERRRGAIDAYRRAASLWHSVQDPAEEGLCHFRAGIISRDLGDRQKALDLFNQALLSYLAAGDRAGEATALNGLGAVYTDLGDKQKALDYYGQALPLRRVAGDRFGEAATLNNMATIYSNLGEKQKALDHYNQALPLWRTIGYRAGEAATVANIGAVYSELGEKQKALEYYNQGLPLLRALGNRAGESAMLNNIGNLYSDLGQKQKALEYYEQALSLKRAIGDRDGEAHALNNLGVVYRDLGEPQKALDYYNQALPLRRAVGNRAGEAATLNNIGRVWLDLGDKQKALASYDLALQLRRTVGDRSGEALTLNNMGRVYLDLGDKQKALEFYRQALPLRRAVGDRAGEAATLGEPMRLWEDRSSAAAIFFGKEAINLYQGLRRDIQGLDQELQRTYLATVSGNYRHLAGLLIAQGRLSEAEQVLGLLKQQEYFDYIRRDAAEASSVSGRADLSPLETESDRRYREIADRLVAEGTEHGELIAKKSLTREETTRIEQLEKDITVGNQQLEKFLSGLAQSFSAKPAAALQVAQLKETQGIMEDLRELPAGTVAVFTVVADDKFSMILRTPDVSKAYEYPIKAAELNRKVHEFRQVVQDPALDPRPYAQDLYKILIGPMAADLRQAKAQTLMWSLDGVLRYLPLAALFDGKQYLIEQYRLSVMTQASNARLKDRPTAEWKAAGFGVTKAYEDAPALPEVSSELRGIIATKPGDPGVLPGEIKLDDQFTQQGMRETLRKHYSVVHIASHFRFQPGDETQSYLLLGDGGRLTMSELKTSANLFGGVEVLTLSACNTGIGDGTEVEGFGTLAQLQGAKAVIASLWPVSDVSTSQLMQEFYRLRQSTKGITKLEALRQAQLEFLRGKSKGAKTDSARRGAALTGPNILTNTQATTFVYDPNAPFSHPFYWAPFFLMGNWL